MDDATISFFWYKPMANHECSLLPPPLMLEIFNGFVRPVRVLFFTIPSFLARFLAETSARG